MQTEMLIRQMDRDPKVTLQEVLGVDTRTKIKDEVTKAVVSIALFGAPQYWQHSPSLLKTCAFDENFPQHVQSNYKVLIK